MRTIREQNQFEKDVPIYVANQSIHTLKTRLLKCIKTKKKFFRKKIEKKNIYKNKFSKNS